MIGLISNLENTSLYPIWPGFPKKWSVIREAQRLFPKSFDVVRENRVQQLKKANLLSMK